LPPPGKHRGRFVIIYGRVLLSDRLPSSSCDEQASEHNVFNLTDEAVGPGIRPTVAAGAFDKASQTIREFKMRKLLLVSVAVIVVFGHAAAQELTTIQAHNDRFAAALKSGDMETIGQTYAEDARIFPPGAEMIEGREAIQGYWKSAADTLADAKLTAVEVKPLSNNYAREIGTFSLKTKGENPQEIAGKYIVIWQKVGDDWKISDDIWNMNK